MPILPGQPGSYTFAEVSGSLTHPLAGSITIGGQLGVGSLTFSMATTRITQTVVPDGYVNNNYHLGSNGKLVIDCLQGSTLDRFLLNWANAVDTAASSGDASNAVSGVIHFMDISTGAMHTGIGVGIEKQPDQGYAGDAAMRQWPLIVSELTNE